MRASAARPLFRYQHCLNRLADQVGLEPTKLSRQLKRLLPLPLGALVYCCEWRIRVVSNHMSTG